MTTTVAGVAHPIGAGEMYSKTGAGAGAASLEGAGAMYSRTGAGIT